MNKKILYALSASLMLAGAACTDKYTVQDEPTPPVPVEPEKPTVSIPLSSEQQEISKRAIAVGQEMFQAMCADPDNAGKTVAFSPMGANSMLCAMAQLGLEKNVPSAFDAIYGSRQQLEAVYAEMRSQMPQLDESVKLSFNNALLCDQAFYDSNNIATAVNGYDALKVDIIDTTDENEMLYAITYWLHKNGLNIGWPMRDIGRSPVLASATSVEAPWGEATADFGDGILFNYMEDAKVRVGADCYSVRVPLGTNGAYEMVIAKANPGVDIDRVIASGDIFDPGNGRYSYKPFTVAIPSRLHVGADVSFDSAIHAVLAKYVPDYEAQNIATIDTFKNFAFGDLCLTRTGTDAAGATTEVISRSWDGGYGSGFINVADGNCVVSVLEVSTKTCLFMGRIAKM